MSMIFCTNSQNLVLRVSLVLFSSSSCELVKLWTLRWYEGVSLRSLLAIFCKFSETWAWLTWRIFATEPIHNEEICSQLISFFSYLSIVDLQGFVSFSWTSKRSSYTYTCACVLRMSLSHVQLFATPWTVACQAPPFMAFSRQEYWSGLSFPSPILDVKNV